MDDAKKDDAIPPPGLTPTQLNVFRGGAPGICREEFDTEEEMRARLAEMSATRGSDNVPRYSPSYTQYKPNPVTGKWTICY